MVGVGVMEEFRHQRHSVSSIDQTKVIHMVCKVTFAASFKIRDSSSSSSSRSDKWLV